ADRRASALPSALLCSGGRLPHCVLFAPPFFGTFQNPPNRHPFGSRFFPSPRRGSSKTKPPNRAAFLLSSRRLSLCGKIFAPPLLPFPPRRRALRKDFFPASVLKKWAIFPSPV